MADPADTALAFLDALEAADFERLVALCAPGFAFAGLTPEPLDVDAFVELERGFHAAFADVRYAPEPLRTEGDVAVVLLHLSGRQVGAFLGIAPAGRRFALPAQEARYTVRGGLVAHAELVETPGTGVEGIVAQLQP